MTKFVIIDYGVGNFRNVQKAFETVGAEAEITASVQTIAEADAVILPGVGAFGDAMEHLRDRKQDKLVIEAAQQNKPVLGICVGLQLLFEESEEMGTHQGLGLLPGKVVRFPEGKGLTIPHMGWNQIEPAREHPLLKKIVPGDFTYFAHSYHAAPTQTEDIIAFTDYGDHFPSIVGRDNISAIQFHPEKSQQVGLQILKNFIEFTETMKREN